MVVYEILARYLSWLKLAALRESENVQQNDDVKTTVQDLNISMYGLIKYIVSDIPT